VARIFEKIKVKNVLISKKLYDEINYAKDNLNTTEKNKNGGKKKHSWTFQEASHELGKMLKSERGKSKLL